MKRLILATALLLSTATFAETGIEFVRSRISSADAQTKMLNMVKAINSGKKYTSECHRDGKVYSVEGPKMSYRVNRRGELQKQWVAVIKYSCQDRD